MIKNRASNTIKKVLVSIRLFFRSNNQVVTIYFKKISFFICFFIRQNSLIAHLKSKQFLQFQNMVNINNQFKTKRTWKSFILLKCKSETDKSITYPTLILKVETRLSPNASKSEPRTIVFQLYAKENVLRSLREVLEVDNLQCQYTVMHFVHFLSSRLVFFVFMYPMIIQWPKFIFILLSIDNSIANINLYASSRSKLKFEG